MARQSVFDIYISEYPGDDAWNNLRDIVIKEYLDEVLEIEGIPDDLSPLVQFHKSTADAAVEWFNGCIPALDGKRPCDFVDQGRKGQIILRVVLMRMK